MFHKTSIRLTGLYLTVLMAISLFFSLSVYQLSTQEFDRGFRQQDIIIQNGPGFGLDPDTRNQLLQEQQERFDEAKWRVLQRLLIINLFILIGGGFLSYYLARRTLAPIEESHQALERFTADASHELRTPLSAMRTETEVALMNPKLTLAESKQKLQSNLEEVLKLTTLSDGLLRLARLENDGITHDIVAVKTLVSRAVNQLKPLAAQKDISLETQLDKGLQVSGEAASLIEALVIILDNAVKYSQPHSPVRVTAQATEGQVEIAIVDQGIGIKPSELKRIFERFYRADAARSKQEADGYGLGLAIARDIIQLHNGSIAVESTPAKGSTFTIRLPING